MPTAAPAVKTKLCPLTLAPALSAVTVIPPEVIDACLASPAVIEIPV